MTTQSMHEMPESSQDLPLSRGGLSERQHTAISLLVVGKTYTEVAQAVGVDRRTLWEWRQNAAFAAELEVELDAIRLATRVRMFGLAERAVETVAAVMQNGYTDGEKLAAARVVLKWLEGLSHGTA